MFMSGWGLGLADVFSLMTNGNWCVCEEGGLYIALSDKVKSTYEKHQEDGNFEGERKNL